LGALMAGVDRRVVVAVDGGGSKTDAAVVDLATGDVLGRGRGPGCSHHDVGLAEAVRVVDAAVSSALHSAGRAPEDVVHAGCFLTGIDLDAEQSATQGSLAALPWALSSLTVANDVFALLRAGTSAPDAAAVVCGTGFNGAAVRADGASARILSLGRLSGDWGGASGLADEVLWHAARAEDGRGAPTALREALLGWTGLPSVHDVVVAVHVGELAVSTWWHRMPDVLALAADGDGIAAMLVERQGDEIGVLAGSLLARLGLSDRQVPVVLGGGIGASGDERLEAAARRALAARAAYAELEVVREPPVLGAIALALDEGRRRTA
jgi:N-acetylglucosamine kinase-like BadF-type ATPase